MPALASVLIVPSPIWLVSSPGARNPPGSATLPNGHDLRRVDHRATDVRVASTPTSSYQRVAARSACELVGLVDQLLGPLE